MIDAHCHIQFQAYNDDRDAVIQRCIKESVQMIAVGTKYSTSVNAVKLAEQYPEWIWATVGFHPTHVHPHTKFEKARSVLKSQLVGVGVDKLTYYHDKNEEGAEASENFDIKKLGELAAHSQVVAIGECGLDYFRLEGDRAAIIKKQKEAFEAQIALATKLQKPLMLHCRATKGADDAYEDLFAVLRSSNFQHPTTLHFYAGSLAMTKKFVDAGYYFTFGGVITFSSDYDEIIKYIPMDRIMLETDAPYVAPVPYRGQRNEPRYVIEVARKLAILKQLSQDRIIHETNETTKTIFDFVG